MIFIESSLKNRGCLVYARVYRSGTPVLSLGGIRFNLDNNLDRRTRNKNTRLGRTVNYGGAVLKSFAILYLIAARDTLYKPFAFRSARIINFFMRQDYHSHDPPKSSLVECNDCRALGEKVGKLYAYTTLSRDFRR